MNLFKKKDTKTEIYDKWIDNIVKDSKYKSNLKLKDLIDHLKKHLDEIYIEKNPNYNEWFSSILNLIEIIKRYQHIKDPDLEIRIERLFSHWKSDPSNMTPPPFEIFNSTSKMEKIKKMEDRDQNWS